MNTQTGQIYRTLAEVEAARLRGEPLVPLSRNMEAAHVGGNRKQRRIAIAERRRAARKAAKLIVSGRVGT